MSKNRGLKLVVVDCDNMQRSFSRMRDRELSEVPEEKRNELYDVLPVNSEDFPNKAKELKEKYDIVLVDFPGNMEQKGVMSIYYLLDVAIVPIVPTSLDIDSTFCFLNLFKNVLHEKIEKFGMTTTYAGLLNKVNKGEIDTTKVLTMIENINFPILQHSISDKVINRNAATSIGTKITSEQRFVFDEVCTMLFEHMNGMLKKKETNEQ